MNNTKELKSKDAQVDEICQWISDLVDGNKRENALLQLRFYQTNYII